MNFMANNFRNIAVLLLICFGIFAFSPNAKADPSIKVTFGPEFALSGQNMLPGDTVKGTFTVENLTDSAQDLAMKTKVEQGDWQAPVDNMEEKMFIKIKKPDGNFAAMPNGTEQQVLSELNNNPFKFYVLSRPSGNTKSFELWAIFDANAGNEYQGKKVVFDILAGIEITGEENGGGGGDGGNENNPAPPALFFSAATPGATAGGQEEIGAGAGQEESGIQGEETGTVAGKEECAPVAWWIFALMLIAYWIVMYFNLFYRIKEGENIRWFWEAVYTILALVGWYYLDRCRTNVWFVYISLISGFILYLFYLYLFRKKMNRDDNPDQAKLPL